MPSVALDLISAHLRDATSTWSIGTFGALAEFARAAGEPCNVDDSTARTPRGAVRVARDRRIRPVAYEALSARPGQWHHGVLFCLPRASAAMQGRRTVTELGPDREAIREEDRDATLFDLGLGAPSFDFCVRTRDPALIAVLRRACGSGFLDPRYGLAPALVGASPHRVTLSRLARIEVYQAIASEDGATPTGPHTHLIARGLRPLVTHSANIALPAGRLPSLALYPEHPAKDETGNPKRFAPGVHAAFQSLLARFGDSETHAAKAALIAAIACGESPASWTPPDTRSARQACRIALRQLRHAGEYLPVLEEWERVLERRVLGRAA